MSRIGRYSGYGLMAAAAMVAVATQSAMRENIGPFPVIAVVLFLGMTGAMLVFTDLMVRGLYAQINGQIASGEQEQERDADLSPK